MPSMQPSAHESLVVSNPVSRLFWGKPTSGASNIRHTQVDSGLPKYYDAAVAIPSPVFETLARTARENHVFLSLGIVEKEGGTPYYTAFLLYRDGMLPVQV